MFTVNSSQRNAALHDFVDKRNPRGMDKPHGLSGSVRRPHICFVAPETWPVFSGSLDIGVVGGAEVQQSILARLFARAGYRVSMICLDYGQPQKVQVDGVMVYRAHHPDAGIPALRFIHPRLSGIWRAMRVVDADIYYQRSAAMLTAVVAGFCRWHGKRSIFAAASDTDFLPGRQLIRYRRDRWLFERGLAFMDKVVVQNPNQQRYCQDNYRHVSTLIPSCYEPPKDLKPGGGECVLWVATLRPNKRPELFLELARRLPQFRFVLVGGACADPGGDHYFDTVRRAALALPNVEFTGFLPLAQVEPYFDQARVFVNTSIYEGMPNTFLQSWARGIPTVAFIDTGARLRDEPVYRVVNFIEEAAGELERLFADDTYRAQVSSRCREHFVATHSSAEALARYETLFSEFSQGAADGP